MTTTTATEINTCRNQGVLADLFPDFDEDRMATIYATLPPEAVLFEAFRLYVDENGVAIDRMENYGIDNMQPAFIAAVEHAAGTLGALRLPPGDAEEYPLGATLLGIVVYYLDAGDGGSPFHVTPVAVPASALEAVQIDYGTILKTLHDAFVDILAGRDSSPVSQAKTWVNVD